MRYGEFLHPTRRADVGPVARPRPGIVEESGALRENGPWQRTVGADLHGRRLGLLGLGKIGSQVARVGLAFGMRVSAWSQNLTEERAAEAGTDLAPSLRDLLATSDFVSVHLALGDRTRGLLGPAELALLKPTAYLINTSRAAIVDQDALLAALHEGRIAGAGVDVFDTEPLPAGHPMRTAPACSPPPPRLRLPRQLHDVLRPGDRGHPGLSLGLSDTATALTSLRVLVQNG